MLKNLFESVMARINTRVDVFHFFLSYLPCTNTIIPFSGDQQKVSRFILGSHCVSLIEL